MLKIITMAAIAALTLNTTAQSAVSEQELFEARLFKEMGSISSLMAAANYECGTLNKHNIGLFMKTVEGFYKEYYDDSATRADVRDWMVSKTAIDYSNAVGYIYQHGCSAYNTHMVNREGMSTFTESFLNYYQPKAL